MGMLVSMIFLITRKPFMKILRNSSIHISALMLSALLASQVQADPPGGGLGPLPPANPWLGGTEGASAPHNDASASDSSPLPGPGNGNIQVDAVPLASICPVMLVTAEGNPVISCVVYATIRPRISILDKDDPTIILSQLDLPMVKPLGASYGYLTNTDQLVLAGGSDSLVVIRLKDSAGEWDLAIDKSIDLSGHVPADHNIISMAPSINGAIWVVTDLGTVVRHDPFTGEIHSMSAVAGEIIVNSLGMSGDGKVAVATDRALYLLKFKSDDDESDDDTGYIKTLWRAEYDFGIEKKPSKLSQGTGSSPTFFGPHKGNEYVTIADNHDPDDRVMIFDVNKKNDPVVCIVDLPTEASFGSAPFGSENSPIAVGRSVVYTNSVNYPFAINPPPPFSPEPIGTGMFRVDVVGNGNNATCEVVWANHDVRNASVPKLSIVDEIIYGYNRVQIDNGTASGIDTYKYVTIDFHTGEVIKSELIGQGIVFNAQQLAGNIGPNKVYYQGTSFGLIKVQAAP